MNLASAAEVFRIPSLGNNSCRGKIDPTKGKGTLARPRGLRSEESLPLFLLCGLLRGFLCSLLSCHVVYSPCPSVMDHCDVTSSQFVLCIELSKKIVKKKKRIELSFSVTRSSDRSAARLRSSPFLSPRLPPKFSFLHRTRMNTGDYRLPISWG